MRALRAGAAHRGAAPRREVRGAVPEGAGGGSLEVETIPKRGSRTQLKCLLISANIVHLLSLFFCEHLNIIYQKHRKVFSNRLTSGNCPDLSARVWNVSANSNQLYKREKQKENISAKYDKACEIAASSTSHISWRFFELRVIYRIFPN